MVDYLDGGYIQSGGYAQFPGDCDTFVSYGTLLELPIEKINLKNSNCKIRSLSSLEYTNLNLDLIDAEVIGFENAYQLPYTETIGLLNAFFSTWTYGYPFEAIVIIDTKRRSFNIPKIIYLPVITKDMMKQIYMKFVKETDSISNYIFRIMEKEKRELKFLIFFHPFGSIIKIKDLDRNTIENVKNYNSTQPHTFMKNIKTGGLKYVCGESFNLLREGELKEPVLQALECSDVFY
jgi:hypothetical protein